MKIKATQVMARAIEKQLGANTCIESVKCIGVNRETYCNYIDYDLYKHQNDWNANKSLFNVLEIVYKPECFAYNRYITTNDLLDAFRGSDRTLNGFIDSVYSMVAI